MNPEFRSVYLVYIDLFAREDSGKTNTTTEIKVLADSLIGAIDKAGEYAQTVLRNDDWMMFDITGVTRTANVFTGIQDETEESELIPETGILSGELPEGWTR